MGTVEPGVSQKKARRRNPLKKIIAIILVIAIAAGGYYGYTRFKSTNTAKTVTQRTATVTVGTITESITGSAPIESAERSEISPKVTATLLKINIKVGDQVKKGDVLFVLDDTDALLNIENTKNNIAQQQLSMDSTAKSIAGLTVKAPYSGQITNVNIKQGDSANKGAMLMMLTDVSKLVVTLPFSGSAVRNIPVGQKATVFLTDMMESVEGKVSYISDKPYTTASGGEVYNVDIQLDNPGSLKDGMKATAEITAGGATLESVDSSVLAYINSTVLKSDAGGTVDNLNVRVNEYVTAGDMLVELTNDDLKVTTASNNIKMENLNSQLSIQQKQLDYYTIVAPFDGTITKMGSANEGDTVKTGETLAVVSNIAKMQFSLSIDELDIGKIALGQVVQVTSDAVAETADTPLTGRVTDIAMEGSSSNGVTTYPVTVTLDDSAAGKIKTGMNIDAEIIVNNKSNILMVPLEAVVTRGSRSFVYVKTTTETSGSAVQFGQNGQNTVSGQNVQGGNFQGGNFQGSDNFQGGPGGFPGGDTSGAAFNGGDFQGGGNWQGGNTTGSSVRTRGSRSGNTSGSAMRGNWSGSTTQGAVQSNFSRAMQNADSYYDGTMMVMVQTGISNSSYIEITSGLSEGQIVVLPKVETTSSTSTSTTTRTGSSSFSRSSGASGFSGGGGEVMIGGGGPPGGGF